MRSFIIYCMITKTLLEQEYLLNGKSTRDLANKYGVCQKTIMNWLNTYNIKKDEHQWIKDRHSKIEHTLFKNGHNVPEEWKELFRLKTLGMKRHITPHSEETKEVLRKKQIKRLSSGKYYNKETTPERLMREELTKRKIKFISQYPYEKGIADFYIPQYNAIIECDGNYWHNYPIGTQKDLKQTIFLVSKGYQVYRFWESNIKEDIEKCIKQIK